MADQTPLTRDELMAYSKRHLVDTILSHIPHLDLLRGELARAEQRAAELEEQMHEITALRADNAAYAKRIGDAWAYGDELERQRDAVLALCDTADALNDTGLWSMVETEEIRAVYASG